MKEQEVLFSSPVKIFQIFRNINLYGKQNKSFDERRDNMEWKNISSKSGYIFNNELYLPEKILQNPDLKKCDLITLEDDMQDRIFTAQHLMFTNIIRVGKYEPIYNNCFDLTHSNRFDIFRISNNEHLELYLEYSYFGVGIPNRNSFKICNITLNNPIEIRINGKTDFSMSSGRERVFKEQYYIIEYLGNYNKCKILREPYLGKEKNIPENRKIIDMQKRLW